MSGTYFHDFYHRDSRVIGFHFFHLPMSSLLEKTRDLSKQLSKAAANSQPDDMIMLLKQLKEVVEPSEELIRVRVFF